MDDALFEIVASHHRARLITRLFASVFLCAVAGAVFINTAPRDEWLSAGIAFLAILIVSVAGISILKFSYDLYRWFANYEYARNASGSLGLETMSSLHSEVVGPNPEI